MNVVPVCWPTDSDRRDELRARGVPRLLLLDETTPVPDLDHALEDWIRLPADGTDISARIAALAARAQDLRRPPRIDSDGLFRYRDKWVALSPTESALATVFIKRFGKGVPRKTLIDAYPGSRPEPHTINVYVTRMRRRLAPLGLEIRAWPSRGYIMDQLPTEGNPV